MHTFSRKNSCPAAAGVGACMHSRAAKRVHPDQAVFREKKLVSGNLERSFFLDSPNQERSKEEGQAPIREELTQQ